MVSVGVRISALGCGRYCCARSGGGRYFVARVGGQGAQDCQEREKASDALGGKRPECIYVFWVAAGG